MASLHYGKKLGTIGEVLSASKGGSGTMLVPLKSSNFCLERGEPSHW